MNGQGDHYGAARPVGNTGFPSMDDREFWIVVGAVLVVLVVLLLRVGALLAVVFCGGAVVMFAWAGQAGPIGFMLMLALWIFAFPVMAVIAMIVGILGAIQGD